MERKLTAILCADAFGYSRLMGENEEETIRNLSAHRNTIDRLIEQYHGRFLPFANLSGDPKQEYFSDGISAQLINELSRLPGLLVIARNSSFAYKGKTTSEHDIGSELGVKY